MTSTRICSHGSSQSRDPEIFRAFCARFGVTPEECLFIDDVAQNVAAAQSLGFHGIVFTSADALRSELLRYGLLA